VLRSLAIALVITLGVNVPIDDAIARWTVDTLPSDWSSTRNRWEAFHAARTFIRLVGFGSALAAALWSREAAALTGVTSRFKNSMQRQSRRRPCPSFA